MKRRPSRCVGIDISKDHLDLACRPEHTRWYVANDSAGIAQCLSQLRRLKPTLIVLETTGDWPCSLVAALAISNRPFAVMNPRQMRDFAKATRPWAQTEALDAGVIAHLAEAAPPTMRESLAQHIDDLQGVINAMDEDVATRTATRCNPAIKAFYQGLLVRGKSQKVAMTAAMRKLLTIRNAMVKPQIPWDARLQTCA
jgi:transposase